MVPPELEPLPTAMQLTELAQATPAREPTPAGAAALAPAGSAVSRGEDGRSSDRSAGRRVDAAEGGQARGSGRGSQVVPRRAAVAGVDHVRPDGHTRRVARTPDAVEARQRRENGRRSPSGATVRGAEDGRTGTDRGRTDCGAIRRADAGDRGEIGDRIWERLGCPCAPTIRCHDDAGRRGAKVAHCVAGRCADTGHRCQDADTGWNCLQRPREAGVSRTDGDGAPKDAEANRCAVGRCRARDSVEAADSSGDGVGSPCVARVDRGEDRVHSCGEAVGGARARDGVQATDARRRSVGDPGQPACRRPHDRRARSRVPAVPHRDAVLGARARDAGQIDCVRGRTLS